MFKCRAEKGRECSLSYKIFPASLARKDSKQLFKLNFLVKIRIKIQVYGTPHKAPQCFNSLRIFSTPQFFCYIQPRCVFCDENHSSNLCPRKNSTDSEEKTPPSCCNCNEKHPPNYKGCKNLTSQTPIQKILRGYHQE